MEQISSARLQLRVAQFKDGLVLYHDPAMRAELFAVYTELIERRAAATRDAAILAAAKALVPLLEEGWDEYDDSETQRAGQMVCDELIAAVKGAAK